MESVEPSSRGPSGSDLRIKYYDNRKFYDPKKNRYVSISDAAHSAVFEKRPILFTRVGHPPKDLTVKTLAGDLARKVKAAIEEMDVEQARSVWVQVTQFLSAQVDQAREVKAEKSRE